MVESQLKKLFGDLEPSLITELSGMSSVKRYEKEEVIFYEGDKAAKIHFLIEGMVAVYRTNDKGNRLILRYFEPPDLIGELANLQNIPFPASACAEEPSTLILIDQRRFVKSFLTGENAAMMQEVLMKSVLAKLKYHVLESIFNPLNEKKIVSKVAMLLLENIDLFNTTKRWKIAQGLRIAPETLSRTLKKLEEDGLIENQNRKITILDRLKLMEYID